jgi:hypothetical protein
MKRVEGMYGVAPHEQRIRIRRKYHSSNPSDLSLRTMAELSLTSLAFCTHVHQREVFTHLLEHGASIYLAKHIF